MFAGSVRSTLASCPTGTSMAKKRVSKRLPSYGGVIQCDQYTSGRRRCEILGPQQVQKRPAGRRQIRRRAFRPSIRAASQGEPSRRRARRTPISSNDWREPERAGRRSRRDQGSPGHSHQCREGVSRALRETPWPSAAQQSVSSSRPPGRPRRCPWERAPGTTCDPDFEPAALARAAAAPSPRDGGCRGVRRLGGLRWVAWLGGPAVGLIRPA